MATIVGDAMSSRSAVGEPTLPIDTKAPMDCTAVSDNLDRLWRLFLALVVLAAAAATPFTAPRAQEAAPMCNQQSFGQTACFSPRLCECIYDRGGAMTGAPAGYRWQCDIRMPKCGEEGSVPASIIEYRGNPPSYPAAVGIDRSNESVNVDQDGNNTNTNTNTNN